MCMSIRNGLAKPVLPGDAEADMLEFADSPPTQHSRLSCQIKITEEFDGLSRPNSRSLRINSVGATKMVNAVDINPLYNEDFRQNPYPYFQEGLENTPIVHHEKFFNKPYSVFRYSDVQNVFKDWETFSSEGRHLDQAREMTMGDAVANIITMDPPRHTRLRRMAQRGFLPSILDGFADRAVELARQRVDYMLEAGECDLVNDFGAQVTTGMITAILGPAGRGLDHDPKMDGRYCRQCHGL